MIFWCFRLCLNSSLWSINSSFRWLNHVLFKKPTFLTVPSRIAEVSIHVTATFNLPLRKHKPARLQNKPKFQTQTAKPKIWSLEFGGGVAWLDHAEQGHGNDWNTGSVGGALLGCFWRRHPILPVRHKFTLRQPGLHGTHYDELTFIQLSYHVLSLRYYALEERLIYVNFSDFASL